MLQTAKSQPTIHAVDVRHAYVSFVVDLANILKESFAFRRIELMLQAAATSEFTAGLRYPTCSSRLCEQAWTCFEYIVTFRAEVRCIWSRRMSMTSAIFISLRYFALIHQLSFVIQYVDWPDTNSASAAVV